MRRYYVPSTRPEILIEKAANVFDAQNVEYAMTHEAAAQRYSPFLSNISQVRCRVLFTALFVQDEVKDVILLKTVSKPHSDSRAHPGTGIKHEPDKSAVLNPTRVVVSIDRSNRPASELSITGVRPRFPLLTLALIEIAGFLRITPSDTI